MKNKFESFSKDTSLRPLIIVTNDDGADALGFANLIEAVRPFGDVLAIAPDTGQSGMSHALTFKKPVRLYKLKDEPGLTVYKLTGTPVDCVKMALGKLIDRKPVLLVSGINHGSNSSISSIYSGTVAAAREGALNAIPSAAFSSLDFSEKADFSDFIPYIRSVCENILADGMPANSFVNVNFPHSDTANIRGLKVCRQASGVWEEEFVERIDPGGTPYYWLTGYLNNFELDATDTDEYFLSENWVSLVPIMVEVTAMDAFVHMKSWESASGK